MEFRRVGWGWLWTVVAWSIAAIGAAPAAALRDQRGARCRGTYIGSRCVVPWAQCEASAFVRTDAQQGARTAPLHMTRKVVFGYKYNAERNKRKGTVRSKIYFDMYKDKHPLYVIHKFLHDNDPNNNNFKYDVELATKPPCTRHIFKHYKKDNKLRFFWYASGKNKPNGPCSRYINFARAYNEFRFSKLESYYHILPYVHEHYRDDPRYIYFMNRFLAYHGRVAQAKRELARQAEEQGLEQPEEYKRTVSFKEIKEQRRREERELYEKHGIKEHIEVKLGDGKSFVVKPDGFKVHGEYYSRIDKEERDSPYDIYTPYYRTRHSSKRRRFRERGRPLNPEERCKTRRERLLKRKAEREERDGPNALARKYLKQKKSFKVLPPPGWVPEECRDMLQGVAAAGGAGAAEAADGGYY